mgnify:CR=1 FL=1
MDLELIEQDIEKIITECETFAETKDQDYTTHKSISNPQKEKAMQLAQNPGLVQKITDDLDHLARLRGFEAFNFF